MTINRRSCLTRTKQQLYRNRAIDKDLVRLVLGISEAECSHQVLEDWFLDHPMHRHDLCILFWRARIEYDGRDHPKMWTGNYTKKERNRHRRLAYELIWNAFVNGNRLGLANSVIQDTCRKELNIDHLGRSLDSVTGRLSSWYGDSVSAGTLAMQEEQR